MNKENYNGIWVFAEQENGQLASVSAEILAKAQDLKAHTGEPITAVLIGDNVESLAKDLFEFGADQLILVEHANLSSYSARPYQKVVAELSNKYRPSIILYGATSIGRDLAPRVMVSLKTGLTADAIDLSFDEDNVFCQTTPAYGGSILAHIVILEKRPQMVTVRPKTFEPLARKVGATGLIIRESVDAEIDLDYEVLNSAPKKVEGRKLEDVDVVIAGGRGVHCSEDLALLTELAELLEGQVGGSRPLVDEGWAEHSRQIGQSGVTIKPKLIINAAISGSVQYQVGMQNSGCIVSINRNEDAQIYDISHYGVVADYKKVLPELIKELKSRIKSKGV